MTGTVSKRFCASCDKHVHDFASMTARQVDDLIVATGGALCARVTNSIDGSVVTANEVARMPAVSSILSIAMVFGVGAMGSSALAQDSDRAVLTGQLFVPDGSKPAVDAIITLERDETVLASAKTDAEGRFAVHASPGTYDVYLRQNALFGKQVLGASLHSGTQDLSSVRTVLGVKYGVEGTYTTGGAMAATLSNPWSYAFRHPIRFVKYTFRKI
jgi:hypothetical protein